MQHILILLIRVYQRVLSPLKPPSCRFFPTCSEFAVEALRRRGILWGTILTFLRILRCNPWCRGGYDPVPERGLRSHQHRTSPKTSNHDN